MYLIENNWNTTLNIWEQITISIPCVQENKIIMSWETVTY